MCGLTRTYLLYYLHEGTNHVDLPELVQYHPSRPRGRSHSQCCCGAFPGAVVVITTTSPPRVSHASACHVYIHVCMYVYLSKLNKKMHYYGVCRSTMRIFFTVIIICFGTKYDANLKIMFCQVYFINFSIHQDPKNNWRAPFKIHVFARFSLVSLSIHPRSRQGAATTTVSSQRNSCNHTTKRS